MKFYAVFMSILVAGTASAGYIVEDAPGWRGDDGTHLYQWESFTSASAEDGPNFPGNEPFPSGNALLFNFGAGAIVSGDGNIYGFGGPLNIHAYAYTDVDVQTVVANVSMHGTELLYDQVMLVWTDGLEGGEQGMVQGQMSINYWEEVEYGPGNIGAIANVSWDFDLSGVAVDIREIGLFLATSGPHSSLDAVTLDIQLGAIPGPAAIAVLGMAGLAGSRRRRS
ncbi:MAG: hypothetical protein QF733_08410 [Phycisphaerales bacterium]|jgi:hypothetical protein|nr:hypothetical protein [Phycisphaerales bacterium]